MRGLHDDRRVSPARAHAAEHAHAVEVGHHEIEHHEVDVASVRAGELREGGLAAVGEHGSIAEPLDHVLEQTALDGIVVDDQDGAAHVVPRVVSPSAVSRFGAILTAQGKRRFNG